MLNSIILFSYICFIHLTYSQTQTIYSFDYSNQVDWAKQWPICQYGNFQSPIQLNSTILKTNVTINLQFQNINRSYILNPKVSFKLKYTYSMLSINFTDLNQSCNYRSLNINWKSRGQHSINGIQSDIQLQIHYQKISGSKCQNSLAIVAFRFFQNNSITTDLLTNTFRIYDQFSQSKSINFNQMLRNSLQHEFFIYQGSLNKPPCSQIVNWVISTTPFYLQTTSIQIIRKFINNQIPNNRKLQLYKNETIYFTRLD